MNKKAYRFIDLFAGLGGFHKALEALGCECVFASELKEDLQKLYRINYPNTRIEGDITKIEPKDIPAHDILCAGFPCQAFSLAGKRRGFVSHLVKLENVKVSTMKKKEVTYSITSVLF